MASIISQKLELLDHDHKRRTASVRVTYTARLAAVERHMTGLRFRESVSLWGADSPDADDRLYDFPTAYFPVEPDGSVSRTRTVTLGEEVLDEDGFPRPTDEVYARITITPMLPSGDSERTNEISHRF